MSALQNPLQTYLYGVDRELCAREYLISALRCESISYRYTDTKSVHEHICPSNACCLLTRRIGNSK